MNIFWKTSSKWAFSQVLQSFFFINLNCFFRKEVQEAFFWKFLLDSFINNNSLTYYKLNIFLLLLSVAGKKRFSHRKNKLTTYNSCNFAARMKTFPSQLREVYSSVYGEKLLSNLRRAREKHETYALSHNPSAWSRWSGGKVIYWNSDSFLNKTFFFSLCIWQRSQIQAILGQCISCSTCISRKFSTQFQFRWQ